MAMKFELNLVPSDNWFSLASMSFNILGISFEIDLPTAFDSFVIPNFCWFSSGLDSSAVLIVLMLALNV